jgi:hypothetical protein
MMTHPLIGSVEDKTDEELTTIIADLSKKFSYMSRMHNQPMMNQLIMTLNTYRAEQSKRQALAWEKGSRDAGADGKIDIQ